MEIQRNQETRFIYLRLKILNGEYHYNCLSVHETQCANIHFFAQRYAAGFYMDENIVRQGNTWYSHFGCVAITVEAVKEISEEHFLILQHYLNSGPFTTAL